MILKFYSKKYKMLPLQMRCIIQPKNFLSCSMNVNFVNVSVMTFGTNNTGKAAV